jgi:hypothetical protein
MDLPIAGARCVAASDSDVVVIDYAIDRTEGLKPLSRAAVERLKRKPDGSPSGHRLFLCR